MRSKTRSPIIIFVISIFMVLLLSASATAAPDAPVESELPADPVRVEFQAEDGKNLVGYYYPSKYVDSTVIVFMHWAGGDQRDYCRLAPWLQNRLDEAPADMPDCPDQPGPEPYWDASWFPVLPEESSYAVFTFDFRDFGESDAGLGSPTEWTLDATAAYQTAAAMEVTMTEQATGLAGSKVAAIHFVPQMEEKGLVKVVGGGGSIGADGVLTGCIAVNELVDATLRCMGAYSWSPGSYLGNIYVEDVKTLMEMEPPVPVYCLAGEQDTDSASTCNSAEAHLEVNQIYAGTGDHGPQLIQPDYDDLSFFLEFLDLTLGSEGE
jgi:hypothetical protein